MKLELSEFQSLVDILCSSDCCGTCLESMGNVGASDDGQCVIVFTFLLREIVGVMK